MSLALSVVEVEYIVANMDSCPTVCLGNLFGELFKKVLDMKMIPYDNKKWDLIGRKSCILLGLRYLLVLRQCYYMR